MPDGGTSPVPAAAAPPPDGFPVAGQPTAYRALLDLIVAGDAPPPAYVRRLALPRPTAWLPGWVESATTAGDEVTWTPAAVFGGYLTCLTDQFAGLAMFTVLPDGARFLTSVVETVFHRPVRPGQLRIEATVVELSGRKATVEVLLHQDGHVAATSRAAQAIWRDGAGTVPELTGIGPLPSPGMPAHSRPSSAASDGSSALT